MVTYYFSADNAFKPTIIISGSSTVAYLTRWMCRYKCLNLLILAAFVLHNLMNGSRKCVKSRLTAHFNAHHTFRIKTESTQDNFQPFQTFRIWQEPLTRVVMKPTKRCDLLPTGSGTLCWQVPVRLLKSMSWNVSFPLVSLHCVGVFRNEQRTHFEDVTSRRSVPLALQRVWFNGQALIHKQPIQTQDILQLSGSMDFQFDIRIRLYRREVIIKINDLQLSLINCW